MNHPRGLLGIDIDGTLIDDNGLISGQVHDALVRASENGWEIVPASGRTWLGAKPVIERLPYVRYAVVSNGACILDPRDGSLIQVKTIPPAIAGEVIRVVRSQGIIPAVYSADIHDQKIYYSDLEQASDYFFRYVIDDLRVVRVEDIFACTGDVLQVGVIAEKGTMAAIRDELARVDVTVMTLPFVDDTWFMQIVNREAKKHIALRNVAIMLNVPEGRLVAVGDNFNDADMIANADIGVAMGNAPAEVKAQARVVVASNNNHGLAEVVDTIILSGAYFS